MGELGLVAIGMRHMQMHIDACYSPQLEGDLGPWTEILQ